MSLCVLSVTGALGLWYYHEEVCKRETSAARSNLVPHPVRFGAGIYARFLDGSSCIVLI